MHRIVHHISAPIFNRVVSGAADSLDDFVRTAVVSSVTLYDSSSDVFADVLFSALSLHSSIPICRDCLRGVVKRLFRNDSIITCLEESALNKSCCRASAVVCLYALMYVLRIWIVGNQNDYTALPYAQRILTEVFKISFGTWAVGQSADLEYMNVSDIMKSCFKIIIPGFEVDNGEFKKLMYTLRSHNTTLTFLNKLTTFVTWFSTQIFLYWVKFTHDPSKQVRDWLDEVDKVHTVYKVDDAAEFVAETSLMQRFYEERCKIYNLQREGEGYLSKLERIDLKHPSIPLLKERLRKLEVLIASHAGSYVGSEGKIAPLVLYIHGEPGVGKTLLSDYLFRDLYNLIGGTYYNPSTDKYAYNSENAYWDGYSHQRVFEIQDVFQARDKEINLAEANTLIHCADESAFPVTIAECDKKNQVYFQSDFIFLTSNVCGQQLESTLTNLINSPEAFMRRLHVQARLVSKNGLKARKALSDPREDWAFLVEGQSNCLDYKMFVTYVFTQFRSRRFDSQTNTAGFLATNPMYPVEEILAIRESVEAQLHERMIPSKFDSTKYSMSQLRCGACYVASESCSDCRLHSARQGQEYKGQWRRGVGSGCILIPYEQGLREFESMLPTCVVGQSETVNVTAGEQVFDDNLYASPCDINELDFEPIGDFPHLELLSEKLGFATDLKKAASKLLDLISLRIPLLAQRSPLYINIVRWLQAGVSRVTFSSDIPVNMFNILRDLVDRHVLDQNYTLLKFVDGRIFYKIPLFLFKIIRSFQQAVMWVVENISIMVPSVYSSFYSKCSSLFNIIRSWFVSGTGQVDVCDNWWTGFKNLWEETIHRRNAYKILAGVGAVAVAFGALEFFMVTHAEGQVMDASASLGNRPKNGPNKRGGTLGKNRESRAVNGRRSLKNPSSTIYKAWGQSSDVGLETSEGTVVKVPGNMPFVNKCHSQKYVNTINNLVDITIGGVRSTGFAQKPHKVITTVHMIPHGGKGGITVIMNNGHGISGTLDDCEITKSIDNHLVIIDLSNLLQGMRHFNDMTSCIDLATQLPDRNVGRLLTVRSISADHVCTHSMELTNVCSHHSITLTHHGRIYKVPSVISYYSSTVEGDCGGPVFVADGDELSIVGIHIAAQGAVGFAGLITREWWTAHNLDLYYSSKIGKDPRFYTGKTSLPDTELPSCSYEYLGRIEQNLMYLPRSTKWTPSPIVGIVAQSAPAPLSGKTKVGDKLMSVLRRAHLRRAEVVTFLNPQDMIDGFEWLKRCYPKTGMPRVLTIEEALFGHHGDFPVASCKSDASVGYPWCEYKIKRKDLFNVVDKTISPTFVDVVYDFIDICYKEQDFDIVTVDFPKDELRSLEKVEAGDVRLFSILPVHFNVILKMLFGEFHSFVGLNRVFGPAEIGMSTNALSCNMFCVKHRFGDDNMTYVYGDISASDKVLPYEVMYLVCEFVNSWYDDDYGPVRLHLIKQLFQPIRVLGCDVYRAKQGMPSGSYLTSLFNSLGYALMLAQCVYDILPECSDSFSISTMGDDNVLSIANCPEDVVFSDFVDWFAYYNIGYTVPKGCPGGLSSDYKEVVFLKRFFIFYDARFWSVMSIDTIFDHATWYRRTRTTKGWSSARLCEEIADNISQELSFYPDDLYVKYLKLLPKLFPVKVDVKKYAPSDFYLDVEDDDYVGLRCTHHEIVGDLSHDQPMYDSPAVGQAEDVLAGQQDTSASEADKAQTDTQLIEQTKEVQVTGLTEFVDHGPMEFEMDQPPIFGCRDSHWAWTAQYCASLYRPLEIYTKAILDGGASPFLRLRPIMSLMSNKYLVEKLNHVAYIRYSITLNIKIIASRFHYGLLMAIFRPMYLLGQGCLDKSGNYPNIKFIDPGNVYSGYDNLLGLSSKDRITFNMTAGTEAVLDIPWVLPKQYIRVSEILWPENDLGIVDIFNVAGLNPADSDPPVIQIYASFSDVQLFGYDTMDLSSRLLVTDPTCAFIPNNFKSAIIPTMAGWVSKAPDPSPVLEDKVSSSKFGVGDIIGQSEDVGLGQEKPPSTMSNVLSTVGSGILEVLNDFIPEMKLGRLGARVFSHLVGGVTSLGIPTNSDLLVTGAGTGTGTSHRTYHRSRRMQFGKKSIQTYSKGAANYGMCNPDTMTKMAVMLAPINTGTSIGAVPSTSTTYYQTHNMPIHNQGFQDTQLESLCSRYTLYSKDVLTSQGNSVSTTLSPYSIADVGVSIWHTGSKAYTLPIFSTTPIGYICSMFAFVRATPKLRVHFLMCPLATTRVKISFRVSNSSYDDTNMQFQRIIDITGTVVEEIEFPFMYPSALLESSYAYEQGFGTRDIFDFRIDMLSPIISQDSVAAPPLVVITEIAWLGAQFSGQTFLGGLNDGASFISPLMSHRYYHAPPVDSSNIIAEGQSQDVVPGSYHTSMVNAEATSDIMYSGSVDIPQSVYHIIKRPYYYCKMGTDPLATAPQNGMFSVLTETYDNNIFKMCIPAFHPMAFISMLYRFQRGSVKYFSPGSLPVVDACLNLVGIDVAPDRLGLVSALGDIRADLLGPYLGAFAPIVVPPSTSNQYVTIPWRSCYPFLPTAFISPLGGSLLNTYQNSNLQSYSGVGYNYLHRYARLGVPEAGNQGDLVFMSAGDDFQLHHFQGVPFMIHPPHRFFGFGDSQIMSPIQMRPSQVSSA